MENTAQQNEKQKRKSSNTEFKIWGIAFSRMMVTALANGAFAALGAAATNSAIKYIGRSKGGADVLPMKRAL